MKKFNIAIIGAGRVAKIHIKNLKKIEGAIIKIICDPLIEDSWKEQYGVEKLTKDPKDIFSDPEISVVFICSPTDTHTDFILQSAQAGKNIFCEKPVGTTEEKILEAYHAVTENKVIFQTGFNRRFDKNHSHVKDLINSHKIGESQILKITSRDPQPPVIEYVKKSGGLFMDMMIHDFDMARFLMGDEVEEVFTYGANLIDPEIGKAGDIDTAIVSLKFKKGGIGVIDNSRKAVYGYDQRIEVFGEKGMLQSFNELENTVIYSSEEASLFAKPKFFFLERYQNAFLAEIQSFFQSLENREETKCTFKDGIMAIRIAKAATESLETSQKVKINLNL